MKTFTRLLWVMSLLIVLSSCDEEFNEIGTDIIGGGNFETNKEVFKVYSYNRSVNSVRTDRLPVYQLGTFNNNIFGRSSASIVSQVTLSTGNPFFGRLRQDVEDANAADSDPLTIEENEEVTRVFLNIPYFTENSVLNDRDGDGVIDRLDADPDDPESDSDNDGLTDIEETRLGINPLDPDTDGDGIGDADDNNTAVNSFARRFELDSIYGNIESNFNIRVDQLTFFLRDLDPNNNFETPQEYFSDMDFSAFQGANVFDGSYEISDSEVLFFNDDDPNTDEDESQTVRARLGPRLRIELDPQFFQENLIDMEGKTQLDNNNNFREFLRGFIISTYGHTENLLMLFDFTGASIDVRYDFDTVDTKGTADPGDDEIVREEDASFVLNLAGNIINLFDNEPFPVDTSQESSRIYLKGGAGNYAEIRLFDNESKGPILEEVRANNWLINEANLVFNVDRTAIENAGGIPEPFRLYLYNLNDNRVLLDYQFDLTQDQNPVTSRTTYGGILERTDDGDGLRYKIRLTEHVNNVLRKDSTNVALGLVVTSNINLPTLSTAKNGNEELLLPQASFINPFGTVLFGSKVESPEDEDNKLKLEIYYTEPK